MILTDTLEKLEYKKVIGYIERYCLTENGKLLVSSLMPYENVEDAVEDGKKVSEAKELLIKNDFPPFDYLPDLNEVIAKSKIEGAVIQARSILDILKLAETSRKLYQYLKPRDEVASHLHHLREMLFVDKVFEHQISKVFEPNGELRDDASPRLKEIRLEIREKEAALRKLVNRILKHLSESYLVQEEYVTQRDGRIVLPIKSEHKRHVRGFIHSESSTGQTVYIEPEETLEMNNEILSLSFAEKREIEKILKNLTIRIGEYSAQLKLALNAIAELDSIFARAKYSIEIIGTCPSFDESRPFEILEGRHPLLLKKLGHARTVPLNLRFDGESVILITGPNAGGKTVTLKTTGLLIALAQAGIPIPALPDTNLHFVKKILVDIGDSQSIEDDLSTFSSHLTNIKLIIESAGEDSLVLLDEIGTGTDPAEGSAIAAAVLLTLRDLGAKVLATTHHGALKLIADRTERFQNASMEFDTDELKPTYKFKQGIPGSSYAFEIASRIGLEKSFIDLAKEHLDTDKTKVEEFLVNLEKRSKDLRDQLSKLEIENIRLRGLANLYQEKIDKLEKQKKEILDEARSRAELYLSEINRKFEHAIKRIRESNAKKEVIKAEKMNIEALKKEADKIRAAEVVSKPAKKKLSLGDYAAISGTNSAGVIEEIDVEKNKAVLLIGSLKVRAKYSDLIPARKSEVEDAKYNKYNLDLQDVSYKLDLRGKRADEAEFEIYRFLDNANMRGMDRVEILHGKGTGALKILVQNILKNYEPVKKFYYANIEYGGDGITVVEFK